MLFIQLCREHEHGSITKHLGTKITIATALFINHEVNPTWAIGSPAFKLCRIYSELGVQCIIIVNKLCPSDAFVKLFRE